MDVLFSIRLGPAESSCEEFSQPAELQLVVLDFAAACIKQHPPWRRGINTC